MCKYEYEKFCNRTQKTMIYCKLHENESEEMLKICVAQYYCNRVDKYCPRNQKENCKNYEQ